MALYLGNEKVGIHLNEQKIYEAGKQAEYDAFWDTFQENGNRTDYQRAFFLCWDSTNFKPKYDINVINASYMFTKNRLTDLKSLLEEQGVSLNFANCTTFTYFLQQSTITHLGEIDTRSCGDLSYIFQTAYSLTNIDKLILKDDGSQKFNTSLSFAYCNSLEHIIFEGCIGQNGLNLQWSTKLSHDSLVSIINCLKDYSNDTSGTQWVVTVGSTNLAKLTTEDLENISAKGWQFK